MKDTLPECAKCGLKAADKACLVPGNKGPVSCPTEHMKDDIDTSRKLYADPEVYEFARQASIQEAVCYINRDAKPHVRHPVKPRVQEICEFAQRMGYKRLGLAYCAGLQREAALLNRILSDSFQVISVICKVGCIPKEEIGIEEDQKVRIGEFESMCSPITQAHILNEAETDFNIIMGLCVGHDSLFFKNALAPTTVFAVKDRVLAHNPLGSIYTLHTYYQRFRN